MFFFIDDRYTSYSCVSCVDDERCVTTSGKPTPVTEEPIAEPTHKQPISTQGNYIIEMIIHRGIYFLLTVSTSFYSVSYEDYRQSYTQQVYSLNVFSGQHRLT